MATLGLRRRVFEITTKEGQKLFDKNGFINYIKKNCNIFY